MLHNRCYIYIYIYIYLSIISNSSSAAAVPDDNRELNNDDFITVMDKKLKELKSSVISELIETMKVLIQS